METSPIFTDLVLATIHDVNNPLGAISMIADLQLEESEPGSELYDDLKDIVAAVDRIQVLLTGMSSAIRAQAIAPQSTSTCMSEILTRVVARPFFECEHTLNIPASCPVFVDERSMELALANLLLTVNSLCADEGEVDISIKRGTKHWHLLVKMPPIRLTAQGAQALLDLDQTASLRSQGYRTPPFGLVGCATIVHNHGGQFTIKDADGLLFEIEIPTVHIR